MSSKLSAADTSDVLGVEESDALLSHRFAQIIADKYIYFHIFKFQK